MINIASAFREMHNNTEPLKLPNVWDAGSARIFEDLGASAIATTSAGVSWALGFPDGDALPVRALADLTRNIVRVIRIPLSVDVEGGYSDDPTQAAENIKPILDAGAVGINIEDSDKSPELLATKIEAVRKAASSLGLEVFINARTDVYLRGLAPEGKRVEETLKRAALYRSAGADGIFVPSLTDAKQITEIIEGVGMPLNLLAWPGLPPAAELGKLGVRRLSAGSGIPQVLWHHASELARDFIENGNSTPLSENFMAHSKLQDLFKGRWPTFLATKDEEPWGFTDGKRWTAAERAEMGEAE
jgi:2-methylisocitrate lyase-like PEP mutase family enzyme